MTKLDQLQQVLTKEVSRKEFLQHVGILVVGAIGLTALTSNLLKFANHKSEKESKLSEGSTYGARAYGR